MKKIVATIILLVFTFYTYNTIKSFKFGHDFLNAQKDNKTASKKIEPAGKHYLENNRVENNSANVVTSIVVSYRGFDTLGEVTVLFLAATGLGLILTISRKKEEEENTEKEMSIIVQSGAKILFPMIFLFGVYVFIHGHLTPGGGFQGGTIIATAYLMMFLSYSDFKINHSVFKSIESLSGLSFIIVGLVGLITTGVFLKLNLIPMGVFNTLFSGGLIPVVYIIVGFKVGSELTAVIDSYRENW
jgi:multicomponent Na+:H+ antiporter subunit B